MSTRPKRVPRDGLFWFEIDNTLDIRPTKTVICEKDQIQIGNFVSIMYGPEVLRAKIVALSGKLS